MKNELEGFIFDGQDKMDQETYQKCSTEEERDTIRSAMSEASDWLYEQEESTERKVGTWEIKCGIK